MLNYYFIFFNLKKFQINIQRLQYFQRPQIQHAKLSCKIQCMKFSVNTGECKEEQSILDAKARSSKESERVLHRILWPTLKVDPRVLLHIFCNMHKFEA